MTREGRKVIGPSDGKKNHKARKFLPYLPSNNIVPTHSTSNNTVPWETSGETITETFI